VLLKTRTLNQHGDQVLSFRRTFLMYRGGHGRPATFPEAKSPLHE
jgi:itaconyl-CoA hydratase